MRWQNEVFQILTWKGLCYQIKKGKKKNQNTKIPPTNNTLTQPNFAFQHQTEKIKLQE